MREILLRGRSTSGDWFYGVPTIANINCDPHVVKLPTIEAEPIRYAKWGLRQSGACDYDCVCSACGESGVPRNNYSSNCGAKMTNVNEF